MGDGQTENSKLSTVPSGVISHSAGDRADLSSDSLNSSETTPEHTAHLEHVFSCVYPIKQSMKYFFKFFKFFKFFYSKSGIINRHRSKWKH